MLLVLLLHYQAVSGQHSKVASLSQQRSGVKLHGHLSSSSSQLSRSPTRKTVSSASSSSSYSHMMALSSSASSSSSSMVRSSTGVALS
jgi:hypothetical protein